MLSGMIAGRIILALKWWCVGQRRVMNAHPTARWSRLRCKSLSYYCRCVYQTANSNTLGRCTLPYTTRTPTWPKAARKVHNPAAPWSPHSSILADVSAGRDLECGEGDGTGVEPALDLRQFRSGQGGVRGVAEIGLPWADIVWSKPDRRTGRRAVVRPCVGFSFRTSEEAFGRRDSVPATLLSLKLSYGAG